MHSIASVDHMGFGRSLLMYVSPLLGRPRVPDSNDFITVIQPHINFLDMQTPE